MIKESDYGVKSISIDAVISCILGGLSILAVAVAIVASYRYEGVGPALVGLLGIISLVSSICGLFFGITAWKSQDGGIIMKRVAVIINAIPCLATVLMYFVGWILRIIG